MPTIDLTDVTKWLIAHIPPFEVRILLILIVLTIFVALVIDRRKHHGLHKSIRKTDKAVIEESTRETSKRTPNNRTSKRSLYERPRLFYSVLASLIVFVIGLTASLLFVRPFVIRTFPEAGTRLISEVQHITVEFDLPIDPEEITFHVSPEINGTWTFERTVPFLPFHRKATFHPEESFYPGNPVVVYITGIDTVSKAGKSHEHAIEFEAPKIPKIEKISPTSGDINIKPEQEVLLEYDGPIGNFVETKVVVTPEKEFKLISEGSLQKVIFIEPLAQDTHYIVSVLQTPLSYEVKTKEPITVGETVEIGRTEFTTVTTPGVTSYEPKGESVMVDSAITVVFDQDMNRESVERHFSMTPQTEGSIMWKDNNTFIFTPTTHLQKETAYTVIFSKGTLSATEGMTKDDMTLSFTTIGRVKVTAITPVSGTYGVDPGNTNISITFNQEVDHNSAQSLLALSPPLQLPVSWNGNTLTLLSAGKLAFSTTYTITVHPGVGSVYGLNSTDSFSSTFSTRSNSFSLNVPLYLQAPGFTCNLVATKMVLKYRGISVDIESVKNSIGVGGDPNSNWVEGYGTHWGPISRYISQYRQVSAKQGWTLTEILTEVQNGNPVILFWYNRYSQPPGAFTLPSGATGYMGMHSEVVRGFVGTPENPTAILVNDPWRGQLSYSKNQFLSTWAYLGNAAVIVR